MEYDIVDLDVRGVRFPHHVSRFLCLESLDRFRGRSPHCVNLQRFCVARCADRRSLAYKCRRPLSLHALTSHPKHQIRAEKMGRYTYAVPAVISTAVS